MLLRCLRHSSGRGSLGNVIQALDQSTGQLFAVKEAHRFPPKGTGQKVRKGRKHAQQAAPRHTQTIFFHQRRAIKSLHSAYIDIVWYYVLRYIGHKRLHDISLMGTLGLSVVLASSRSWSTHQMRQMLNSKKLWRTKSRSVPSWSIPVPRCSIQFAFGHLYTC